MEAQDFWNMFTNTGEPMAYLLFRQAAEEQKEPYATSDGQGSRDPRDRFW